MGPSRPCGRNPSRSQRTSNGEDPRKRDVENQPDDRKGKGDQSYLVTTSDKGLQVDWISLGRLMRRHGTSSFVRRDEVLHRGNDLGRLLGVGVVSGVLDDQKARVRQPFGELALVFRREDE